MMRLLPHAFLEKNQPCLYSTIFNRNFTSYFLSILPFCRKSHELKALNSLLVVYGLFADQSVVKQYIQQCCFQDFPDLALPAFKAIEKPSLHLQNTVLRSLSDNGLFEDVLFVYKKCRSSGFCSDNYTYPFVIKACAAQSDVGFGKMTHSVVLRTGYGGNLVVLTALVDFYAKLHEMDDARKMLDEISEPDLVAWNALMSGYSVNRFDYDVFEAFQDMRVAGMKPNVSTLATLFPVCSRVGIFNFGVSLQGLAYKLGYCDDESLAPALISMYANCGDLLAAKNIFDTLNRNNFAIWNAMISAYTRNHQPENAILLFRKMLLGGVKPDAVTFVSVLPSSENIGSILTVESLHSYVVKFGFEKYLSVATALLSLYGKLGNMVSSEFLFHYAATRNLLLWNSMVSSYVGNGFWEKSLGAFRAMQINGFDPDAISIISILLPCSALEATLLGKSAHAFTLKKTIDSNLNLSNAFLAFYCDCNEFSYSLTMFNRMFCKNVISWNTMISGCVDNGEPERAMLLLHQMRREGENFDLITLINILPICHLCQNIMFGLAIHSHATKTALLMDISLGNALVSMYVNCGELDAAKLLFDCMPDKTVVSWNAILTGCRHNNLQKETLELFNKMIEANEKPNCVTLLNVLPACHTALQGKSIHAYTFRKMISFESPLMTSLMLMYTKFENLNSCLMVFSMEEKRSISLWNTVMSAHLISKNHTMVFFFFRDLLRTEIEPDVITVLNLISACVQLNSLQISNSVLAYLVRIGFDKDTSISNALIDLYAKSGSISFAITLFEALSQKDTISWSAMINGYAMHGDGDTAVSLYSQMRLLGLKPDRVTYLSALSACSHGGLAEKAQMVLDSMIQDGLLPGSEHYTCMIDLLGRMGHVDEAFSIVKNLPPEFSTKILESLLGACVSHGNYEIGEEIGRLVMETKPKSSGPYVILYNIFAAAGKWAEAKNVRLLMEQNQLFKPPGMSLVDGNTFRHAQIL